MACRPRGHPKMEDVLNKNMLFALVLASLAAQGGATDLQDWSTFEAGVTVGTYADKAGSKVDVAQVEGPAKGEKAMQLSSHLVQWGGAWAAVAPGLDKAGGLRFKAKAAANGLLLVSLTDSNKVQVEAWVRVRPGAWQDFELPLRAFRKASWQDPAAPRDGAFDPAKLRGFNLSSRSVGDTVFTVGPVQLVDGQALAKTGFASDGKAGALVVQDFETLEASAYGPFSDDKLGSKISLTLKDEIGVRGNQVGVVDYDMKPKSWCGYWMRAGDDWSGQDWSGAKELELRVYSREPLQLQVAFNDANQNAYVGEAVGTAGKGWELLKVPFASFALNAYYQPPQAKKGAPLDLSHVETFNLAPLTEGKHSFQVDDVILNK